MKIILFCFLTIFASVVNADVCVFDRNLKKPVFRQDKIRHEQWDGESGKYRVFFDDETTLLATVYSCDSLGIEAIWLLPISVTWTEDLTKISKDFIESFVFSGEARDQLVDKLSKFSFEAGDSIEILESSSSRLTFEVSEMSEFFILNISHRRD